MAYNEISLAEAAALPSNCEHAAHVMLYSKLNQELFGVYPLTSVIMVYSSNHNEYYYCVCVRI